MYDILMDCNIHIYISTYKEIFLEFFLFLIWKFQRCSLRSTLGSVAKLRSCRCRGTGPAAWGTWLRLGLVKALNQGWGMASKYSKITENSVISCVFTKSLYMLMLKI